MNLFRAISNLLRFDRTNWKALTLCFLAAAIFWIFNALNKNYSTNVKFPLRFEYDETRYIATESLPSMITLNVQGNGWELLRKSLGLKVPTIDLLLERPLETKKIVGASLSPVVAGQIGPLQINYIVSDTLYIKIESRISRKVKLVPDLSQVSFKKGFGRISLTTLTPDSVELTGPKSLVEAVNDSLALKVAASRISANFGESVEIKVSNNELISRNPPVTEVVFEVAPILEQEHLIRLIIPKMPWAVEIDSDSILCLFSFPMKDHDRFVSDIRQASASIILPEIKKGETISLYPHLAGIPSYATVVRIDSVKLKKY